jgi:predicted metalloprotease with PDZ domain
MPYDWRGFWTERLNRVQANAPLGITFKEEGAVISDVVPGTPADAAGIAPDSNLIAINRT